MRGKAMLCGSTKIHAQGERREQVDLRRWKRNREKCVYGRRSRVHINVVGVWKENSRRKQEAKPQHTSVPSWSVRLMAAPRSVGPAVFWAHRQTQHTSGFSWSVRLMAAPRSVGPAVFWAHRQTQHTSDPSWSVRLLAAPRSVGPSVFLGSPPTLNIHLVPPGVCGSWPLLAVWDPRISWAHRLPVTHIWSLLECAAPGRSSQCGTNGFPGLTANPPPQISALTHRERHS